MRRNGQPLRQVAILVYGDRRRFVWVPEPFGVTAFGVPNAGRPHLEFQSWHIWNVRIRSSYKFGCTTGYKILDHLTSFFTERIVCLKDNSFIGSSSYHQDDSFIRSSSYHQYINPDIIGTAIENTGITIETLFSTIIAKEVIIKLQPRKLQL